MKNVEKAAPNVVLDILGAERKLVFTMWSVAQMKRLIGINILKGGWDPTDPEIVISLIWGGLLGSDKRYDGEVIDGKPDDKTKDILQQIGRELHGPRITEAMKAVNDALIVCFPELAGDDAEEEEKNESTPEAPAAN